MTTPEDDRLLADILRAVGDPPTFAARIREYYREADRADRTSLAVMYFHMGILVSIAKTAQEHHA